MRSQMEAVQRGSDVIIATPGRLLDFVERNIVKLGQLKCLTLDEADEMLKQGFKEDIERVFKAVMDQISTKPQTLLFSATLPSWVRSISEQYQEKNCTVVDLIGNSQITVPDTIRHYTYSIQNLEQIPHAVKILC
jgi:superfamily II DNA/RNA helicase